MCTKVISCNTEKAEFNHFVAILLNNGDLEI